MTIAGPETVTLRFARGDATADEIGAAVDELRSELGDPGSEAARSARRSGYDPARIAHMTVRVREHGQGAEPLLTAILVGITVEAATRVAEAVWTQVIWPFVRRRLGVRALGARVATDSEHGG